MSSRPPRVLEYEELEVFDVVEDDLVYTHAIAISEDWKYAYVYLGVRGREERVSKPIGSVLYNIQEDRVVFVVTGTRRVVRVIKWDKVREVISKRLGSLNTVNSSLRRER